MLQISTGGFPEKPELVGCTQCGAVFKDTADPERIAAITCPHCLGGGPFDLLRRESGAAKRDPTISGVELAKLRLRNEADGSWWKLKGSATLKREDPADWEKRHQEFLQERRQDLQDDVDFWLAGDDPDTKFVREQLTQAPGR